VVDATKSPVCGFRPDLADATARAREVVCARVWYLGKVYVR